MKTRLRTHCPAKINLFLHVTGRRSDGYHLLESLFCPVSLYDHLELEFEEIPTSSHHQITRSGSLVHLPQSIDLTYKACRIYLDTLEPKQALRINIHIDKHIPDQAGLGGGSSNAASVLLILQKYFNQALNKEKLKQLALALGADVPFFLQTQPAFIEGIGEKISPVRGLNHPVLIYKPPENCPTKQIFQSGELTRDSSTVKIAVFDSSRLNASQIVGSNFWEFLQTNTQNNLQKVVELLKPSWLEQFKAFKKTANSCNAVLSRMTGSGSAMFAVFENESQRDKAFSLLTFLPGQLYKCGILEQQIETG